MHDGWDSDLRTRQDRRAWIQLGLALVGGAAVFGSLAGAALGWVSSMKCWCCRNDELR